MSDSVRFHRWQPTRLPRPWGSPGKNTGVGCHFLLQCMKVKSESEVAQPCPTLSDPMDCSLPGSSVHVIFQARVLEWVPLPSPGKGLSKAFSQLSLCIHPLPMDCLLLCFRAHNFTTLTTNHYYSWHSLIQLFMPLANLPLYVKLFVSFPLSLS